MNARSNSRSVLELPFELKMWMAIRQLEMLWSFLERIYKSREFIGTSTSIIWQKWASQSRWMRKLQLSLNFFQLNIGTILNLFWLFFYLSSRYLSTKRSKVFHSTLIVIWMKFSLFFRRIFNDKFHIKRSQSLYTYGYGFVVPKHKI